MHGNVRLGGLVLAAIAWRGRATDWSRWSGGQTRGQINGGLVGGKDGRTDEDWVWQGCTWTGGERRLMEI